MINNKIIKRIPWLEDINIPQGFDPHNHYILEFLGYYPPSYKRDWGIDGVISRKKEGDKHFQDFPSSEGDVVWCYKSDITAWGNPENFLPFHNEFGINFKHTHFKIIYNPNDK